MTIYTMNEIGNYKIIKKLGEGGMGEVFMGEDVMLERKVAIKILRPELSQREDILRRFRSEAVALGRLNHPNIATVYTFARDGERYFLAMEFVNGDPLDVLLNKRGKLNWPEAVSYAISALAALEHAHRLNVVHRDVKPANIMLSFGGEIKLMDFGIARILEHSRQTRTGHTIGTLEYISPEQAQGLEVDARSDIYSMAAVLYEMLTGRLLFQKKTDYDLMQAQIKESPCPPRKLVSDIPKPLENIIMKALEKTPAKRFSSALEFSKALSTLNPDLQTNIKEGLKTRLEGYSHLPYSSLANQPKNFMAVLKNYPLPIVAALLMAVAIPFFVINIFSSSATPITATIPHHDNQPMPKVVESEQPKHQNNNYTVTNEPRTVELKLQPEASDLSVTPHISSSPTEYFKDEHIFETKKNIELQKKPKESGSTSKSNKIAKEKTPKAHNQAKEKTIKAKLAMKPIPASIEKSPPQQEKSATWTIIPGKTQKIR